MTIGLYILDESGTPIEVFDQREWAAWMDTANRHVAEDYDEGDGTKSVRVSTIFLGVNMRLFGEHPPLLWETMVFGGPLARTQRRYASLAEAVAGHQEMCQRVMAAAKSD